LDPHRPITQVFTGQDLYESQSRDRAASTSVFGIFALVAIALAAAGTFGVMSFFVGQKLREMGIRVALGAGRGEVIWLVLRVAITLSAAGTTLGLLGVLGVSSLLQSLLYGVGALDPMIMVAAGLSLALVAGIAGGLPAMRASRADPVWVMKAE
jgi:ABC-type antimicrobial peptide transport system permease subunit